MIFTTKYPVVIEGLPPRCRSRKSVACVIDAEVEVREYALSDVTPGYVVETPGFVGGGDTRVALHWVGDALYRPLKSAWLPDTDISRAPSFFDVDMRMGGAEFTNFVRRFSRAYNGRSLPDVWPSWAMTSDNRAAIKVFDLKGMKALPELAASGVVDFDEGALAGFRLEAARTASNVIAIDGKLHTRTSEPVSVFFDWEEATVGYGAAGDDYVYVDEELKFSPARASDESSPEWLLGSRQPRHLFPAGAMDDAVGIAERVLAKRRLKRSVRRGDGVVEVLDGRMTSDDALRSDWLRFAKQCVVVAATWRRWHYSSAKLPKQVQWDVEAAEVIGEALGLYIVKFETGGRVDWMEWERIETAVKGLVAAFRKLMAQSTLDRVSGFHDVVRYAQVLDQRGKPNPPGLRVPDRELAELAASNKMWNDYLLGGESHGL